MAGTVQHANDTSTELLPHADLLFTLHRPGPGRALGSMCNRNALMTDTARHVDSTPAKLRLQAALVLTLQSSGPCRAPELLLSCSEYSTAIDVW
jgi:hypothetical protein